MSCGHLDDTTRAVWRHFCGFIYFIFYLGVLSHMVSIGWNSFPLWTSGIVGWGLKNEKCHQSLQRRRNRWLMWNWHFAWTIFLALFYAAATDEASLYDITHESIKWRLVNKRSIHPPNDWRPNSTLPQQNFFLQPNGGSIIMGLFQGRSAAGSLMKWLRSSQIK